jgi:hypothetical protein
MGIFTLKNKLQMNHTITQSNPFQRITNKELDFEQALYI